MFKDKCSGTRVKLVLLGLLGFAEAGPGYAASLDQPYRSVGNPFQNRFYNFDDPAYYQAGNFLITPTLYAELGFDDNLLNSESNFDPVETMYLNTDAYIEAVLKDRRNSYGLSYRYLGGDYFDSSQDDYNDHKFNADIYLEANSKNAVNLYGEYFLTHEARGTGFSEGVLANVLSEPLLYNDALLGAQYTLGNTYSQGRMELEASWFQREWDSYSVDFDGQAVDVTASRNREAARLRGAFFYGITAKTDLLFEAHYGDISYETPPPTSYNAPPPAPPPGTPNLDNSLDSQELYGLLGLTWAATSKTTGIAKLGLFSKDFSSADRDDFSSVTWDIRLLWEPMEYSRVQAKVRRFPQETEGTGNFIDTQQYAVGWKHGWLERLSTNLDFSYFNNKYEQSDRDDDLLFVTIRADYDILRWLSLGAGYRYQQRSSTEDLLDYDRNRLFISAALSL